MNVYDDRVCQQIKEWILYAEADLAMAKHGLNLPMIETYPLIGFHAQQCAEKSLKAYLIYLNIDFPYTHNISLLLELCAPKTNWTDELEDAKILSEYASTLRYPRLDSEVTKDEAIQAIEIAEHVCKVVKEALIAKGLDL